MPTCSPHGAAKVCQTDNAHYHGRVTKDTVGEDIGDRLVSSAVEVFAEAGYDRATVAEIARRAGVTTGAIYSRYRGKADLMADALGTHLVRKFDLALPEAPTGGVDLLASLGAHLVDPTHSANWLIAEAIVATRRDPELADMIRRSFEEEQSRINKAVQQAKDDGQIDRSLSTVAVAQFAMAVGMGMGLGPLVGREQPTPDEWDAVITRVIRAASPELSHLFGDGDHS